MTIIFSPWRRLCQALMIAFGGGVEIYAAIYHSPYPHPLYNILIFAGAVELLAVWLAFTALRYIWAGTRVYFGGPK